MQTEDPTHPGGHVASLKPCRCAGQGQGCAGLVVRVPRAIDGVRPGPAGHYPDSSRRLISPSIYLPSSNGPLIYDCPRFQQHFIYDPYHAPYIMEISSFSAPETCRREEPARVAVIDTATGKKKSVLACWPCRSKKVRHRRAARTRR